MIFSKMITFLMSKNVLNSIVNFSTWNALRCLAAVRTSSWWNSNPPSEIRGRKSFELIFKIYFDLIYDVIYEFRICNDITNIDWQKFNYPFLQLFQKTNIDNDIFISFVLKWQWQLTIQMMGFICMFIFGRFCTKSWFARHKLHIV